MNPHRKGHGGGASGPEETLLSILRDCSTRNAKVLVSGGHCGATISPGYLQHGASGVSVLVPCEKPI